MAVLGSGDFAPILDKIDNLKQVIEGAPLDRALTQVGMKAKAVFLESAESWAGSDRRLSGWKRGGQLSVGFDVEGQRVIVKPRPYGLWVVGDRGRRETSAPRRGKGKNVRISFGPNEVATASKAGPIRIGSTRGHQIYTLARKKVEREAGDWLFTEVQREVRKVWG